MNNTILNQLLTEYEQTRLQNIKDLDSRKKEIFSKNPRLEEIEKESSCFTVSDLAIGGRELAEIGIQPSPEMGRILETLLDEVMDEKINNSPEALLKRAEELK